ncbi:MAG: acyltransferase [Cyanobacteria bacterium P01_G01_bin.54]
MQNKKLTYFPALDGIRGIAILMVMVFHIFQDSPLIRSQLLKVLDKFSIFGQTGVDLFFVLSGFLITRILLNSKPKKNYFKNFYARRSLRIFPLYYLVLVVLYILIPLFSRQDFLPISEQFWFWTYLQNVPLTFRNLSMSGPGHFWSLAIEEHFYILWPLIVYALNLRGLFITSTAIIISAFLSRVLLFFFVGHNLFYFTLCRLDALVIGGLLALLEHKSITLDKFQKFFGVSAILLITLLIMMWFGLSGAESGLLQYIKYPLLATFYCLAIGYVTTLRQGSTVSNKLQSGFLTYTGRISYGLYVFHPFCFEFVLDFFGLQNFWVNSLVSFLTSYCVASLSFFLFEKTFLKLKKYF